MRKQIKRAALSTVVTGMVAAVALAGGVTASAADATAFPTNTPDITSLLSEFYQWWTPKKIADPNNKNPQDPSSNTAQGSAFRGNVTDAGVSVLNQNDDTVVAINNKAAQDDKNGVKADGTHTQAQRAGIDAVDNDAYREFSDALGGTIAGFVKEGLDSGALPKTNALVFDNSSKTAFSKFVGTGTAKTDFNYPRPYTSKNDEGWDRTFNGANDLKGLQAELNIVRFPMFTENGTEFGDDYTDVSEPSQAFPSGHTTKAYNRGLGLATLLPELGTELVTRSSEAGNNRVVLGVHYPLDVIGGRISASADVAALWSDANYRQNVLLPAHDELENYIASRCKAANLGDTVAACVANTGANDKNGYKNSFTDAVSTKPVTDRASAIDAYTARMTYGFEQIGQKGQAPKVPDNAGNLLITAFPTLTDAQRKQILAASESDSGYPLDSTSEGYQRINLAKAFSAKVTLSEDKSTILGITFGNSAPSVKVVSSSGDAVTNLLSDFRKYWTPGVGVTDEGKSVLQHDDELTEEINQDAAKTAGTANDQTARAYSDSKMDSTLTLYDALGPVIGKYYKEGMDQGKLAKTSRYLKDMDESANTGTAKNTYSHPRPYVDRVNYNGTTLDLKGLKATLNITKTPAYQSDGEYDGLAASGSFPSGHTTFAFTQGAGLASILPEFGTEIMTRVSEAGNNRIVLGVHYPLDILGGHIAGQYGVATALGNQNVKNEASQARSELVGYLTDRCKADGNGDTLDKCIAKTGATTTNGYKNSFTDAVSTKPVTDRASAIDAYKARMTYGFARTGEKGQAAVVPDAAVNLLDNVDAFKSLTTAQKKQVLAMTEGDSGYPLDASSQGWARIDLAAVYSAKVILDSKGNVVSVKPGQATASVTEASSSGPSNKPNAQPNNKTSGNATASSAGNGDGTLSKTGSDIVAIAIAAMVMLAGAGATIVLKRRG